MGLISVEQPGAFRPPAESNFDKVIKGLMAASSVIKTGTDVADSFTKWKQASNDESYKKSEEAKIMSDVAKSHEVIPSTDPRYANAIPLNPNDPNTVKILPKMGISYDEMKSNIIAGFGKDVSPDEINTWRQQNPDKSPESAGFVPVKELKGHYYDSSPSKDNPKWQLMMSEIQKNLAEAAAKGKEKEKDLNARWSTFAEKLADPTSRSALGREAYTSELGMGLQTLLGDLDHPNESESDRLKRYNAIPIIALPEIATSLATLVNRGNQATGENQENYTPSSFEIQTNKLIQKLSNTSTAAEAGSLIKQISDMAKRQVDTNRNVLAQRVNLLGAGFKDLKDENEFRFNKLLDDSISIDARKTAQEVLSEIHGNKVNPSNPQAPAKKLTDYSEDEIRKLTPQQQQELLRMHP